MKALDVDQLDWDKGDGLLPAVVQDARTGAVLMLGYMNRAALAHTQGSGNATFFSRSRQQLWTKGETSGNFLRVRSLHADCDGDTLLVVAEPSGPTCHTGMPSCFGEPPTPALAFLAELDVLVGRRKRDRPSGSYTSGLFAQGLRRIAQKVGEEGIETALAAVSGDEQELLEEAADLVFHLIVLLRARGRSLADVADVLARRHTGTK